MLGALHVCCFLVLTCLHPHRHPAEDGVLVLNVTNIADKPERNITLTCKGGCSSQRADDTGLVRLKLPPQTKSGDPVTIIVVQKGGLDWALISPWDGRVIVPSFANSANNFVSVVVARRGDKQILSSGKAVEAIVARTLKEVSPKLDQQISDEERRLVLKQQAEAVKLTVEEVDQAIRQWSDRAKDSYQQGLAALYEKKYPKAVELLNQSYELRKAEAQGDADVAFFLGQSLYEQGRYDAAADRFKEAVALRKEDAGTLNWLGLSLLQAGRYAEAELLFKRALDIREKALGKEHPGVATVLENYAVLLVKMGRSDEANNLKARARQIREKLKSKGGK